MSVVENLIADLGSVCAGLPDQRKGPRRDGDYSMADIGLSAFSLFFMGSPSFLEHQRALERGQGRSNCQTLFGMSAIPSDKYIRLMLDGASPAAFDSLFMRAIVLKTNGYNLEHNFGHGKQTLASVFLTLNLLAFAFHTAAHLAMLAWREAVAACGATYRFFENLRTITANVVFVDWPHLLQAITTADLRPP